MGQWLDNGVWRVEVTDSKPYSAETVSGRQKVGYKVTEIWRNVTQSEIAPGDSLISGQVVILHRNIIGAGDTHFATSDLQTLASHRLKPSAQYTYAQRFIAFPAPFNPSDKPTALNILFDGSKLAKEKNVPHFTVKHYDFLFKLDCRN